METYIKLNSQIVGKDKIARLLQYASRVLWDYLQTHHMSPPSVEKLKSLEYNFSTFRKILRLGKSLEVLYGALKSIHLQDMTIRVTLTMSKIATTLFLLTDHIVWFGRSGLATVDLPKWSNVSMRWWLYSIIMNLVRDFYELKQIFLQQHISFRDPVKQVICKKIPNLAYSLVNEHKDVLWDTVKNGCDVWIPLTALGYTKFKPGTIGLLGTISSIAGIISILHPFAKLVPS